MIQYINGDATNPDKIISGNKLIVHVCNCNNGWGKGFVLSLSKKWKKPEQAYRSLFPKNQKEKWKENLGLAQFVKVSDTIFVANMIAQDGFKGHKNPMPLQILDLEICMATVANFAKQINATIHGPRFGCGLAGGNWEIIEPLIKKHWNEINVFIYDL